MKAHDNSFNPLGRRIAFEQRKDSLLHCNYCGSLSVAEAIKALETPGTQFSGSDWKYGWPHKFYLDIPTGQPAQHTYTIYDQGFLNEGRRVSKEEWVEHKGSKGTGIEEGTGHIHAKFYTEHLVDATPEELARFNELSIKYLRISFEIADGVLRYRAPHHGFQNWGTVPASV
jgi:hypothetical protein